MGHAAEISLLLAALRSHAGLPLNAEPADLSAISASTLFSQAAAHSMWGILDQHWPRAGDLSEEAERARFIVSSMAAQNARRNAEIKLEINNLAVDLGQSGLTPVFLKGAAFLLESPESALWRMMADIDVLVMPTEAMQAYEVLLAHGYQSTAGSDRYRAADHQHLPPLVVPNSGYVIELHTRLIWDTARNPVATEDIFASALLAGCDEVKALIPSAEHRLAHLIAHAQIGDRNHAACQILLKDIADFAVLGSQVTCWDALGNWFTQALALPEWNGFLAAARLLLGDAVHALPAGGRDAERWAQRAVRSLNDPGPGRNRLVLHLIMEYLRRVMTSPSSIALVFRTLIDPGRRADFFGTHYRRWRR